MNNLFNLLKGNRNFLKDYDYYYFHFYYESILFINDFSSYRYYLYFTPEDADIII